MFDPKKMFDMLKNASELQKSITEKLRNQKATGESAAGMVKVVMNGHFEVEAFYLEEQLLKEEKSFIEDVIKAAINDCTRQIRGSMSDQLKSLIQGFGIT